MNKEYDYKELIGYQIIKGEVFIKRHMLKLFQDNGYDLTFEQWTVLNVINAEPGLIQSEAAEKTYKDKTNVTRILDVLSKRDFIVRERDETDRRSYRIFLTDKGKAIFNDLIPLLIKANKKFIKDIPEENYRTFSEVLQKICENIE